MAFKVNDMAYAYSANDAIKEKGEYNDNVIRALMDVGDMTSTQAMSWLADGTEQPTQPTEQGAQPTREEAINAWNTRPNPWHAGTPTEEGWYLVCLNKKFLGQTYHVYAMSNRKWIGLNVDETDMLAWQKIEPYKGE